MENLHSPNLFIKTNKNNTGVYFFIYLFLSLAFISGNDGIYVPHINTNHILVITFGMLFFLLASLFKKPAIDRISVLFTISIILGLIPYLYVENVNSYWGNFLPLVIALFSYYITVQSKGMQEEKVSKIIMLVSIIISLQIILTEYNYFSNLSLRNLSEVSVKGAMKIPIGSSNLLAAFLLPMIIFMLTYKRSFLAFLFSLLSLYAMVLTRSKNAILLIILILAFMIIRKVYGFILKDKTVNKQIKILLFIGVSLVFAISSFGLLSVMGVVISDLAFTYQSPYANSVLNYLDTISSGRIVVFQNELLRFGEHVILGNGFGYDFGDPRSHNWIIEALVQRGVVGFMIYIFCVFSIFQIGIHYYDDKFIRACTNLLIIIFLQGLFEITIFTVGIDFFTWSIAGFMVARARLISNRNPANNFEE